MAEAQQQQQQHGRAGLKIVVVGDGACGKTCLLKTFNSGQFPENMYVPTIFDLCIKDIEYQGHKIELQLWDTAGQEDYDRLRLMSYPDTDIVLICFSVETIESLENTFEKWLPEVSEHASSAKVLLVALKIDLRIDQDVLEHMDRVYQRGPVSDREGRMVAAKLRVPYIECSARRNQHVSDVFLRAIELALPDRFGSDSNKPTDTGGPGCCSIL